MRRELVLDVLASGFLLVLVLVLVHGSPLRAQGGDTVPGRLGMVTMACDGASDLGRVEWLRWESMQGRKPYWARVSEDQGSLVSTFGPGSGYLGFWFFLDVEPGAVVYDQDLMRRARWAASVAVVFSALCLFVGLRAHSATGWSFLGAVVAALSFAGVGSLAQGLWQQSAALPFLCLGLCAGSWARQHRALLVLCAFSLVMAASLRPPDALLCLLLLGFGVARASEEGDWRSIAWRVAAGASVGAAPMLWWSWGVLGHPLSVGQWGANEEMAAQVFVLSWEQLWSGLSGLLVSPGRGLVWFAPLASVGLWLGWRDVGLRWLWCGLWVQVLVAALFHKWWGGLCFGPRLLALSCWVGIFFVISMVSKDQRLLTRLMVAVFGVWTVLVGVAGAFFYDAGDWEAVKNPDRTQAVLWEWVDSPWAAVWSNRGRVSGIVDAPPGPFVYCAGPGDLILSSPQ